MKYSKTWIKVKFDNSIELIEHPLTGILIPKIEFADEFETLLLEFDGSTASDYFDFYYSACPLNQFSYKFRDDDAKEDFINACIDLGLMPTFQETLHGETKEEKGLRKNKSSQDLCNDFANLKSKEMSKKYNKENSYKHKANQLKSSFDKLIKEVNECQDDIKKVKLQQKLDRVISMMEHSM